METSNSNNFYQDDSNIQDIDKNKDNSFECPICYTSINFDNPHVKTHCNHIFCFACYTNHQYSGNHYSSTCPICRSSLLQNNQHTPQHVESNPNTRNLLQQTALLLHDTNVSDRSFQSQQNNYIGLHLDVDDFDIQNERDALNDTSTDTDTDESNEQVRTPQPPHPSQHNFWNSYSSDDVFNIFHQAFDNTIYMSDIEPQSQSQSQSSSQSQSASQSRQSIPFILPRNQEVQTMSVANELIHLFAMLPEE